MANLLDTITDLGQRGVAAYTAVTRPGDRTETPPVVAPTATPTQTQNTEWKAYLPWAIGGFVVLIVVGLIFRGGSSKP